MKRLAFGLAMVAPAGAQDFEALERKLEMAREAVMMAQVAPVPPKPPEPLRMAKAFTWESHDGESNYRNGKRALEKRDWEQAIRYFDRLSEAKADRADAALYWKAYALSKLGRKQESLAALADLAKLHASSRWLNDARALEIEVKQSSGQPVSPDSEGDEELKLLALNGLMRTDPERAFPALEKILTASTSPRLKERALFVAAHNRSAKTRELLLKYARGGTNPDLQARAVEYLGHQNSPETLQALEEIYTGAGDAAIKRSVLRAYAAGRAKDRLLAAARAEKNLELKREAIRGLGECDAEGELWQLWGSESGAEIRMEIVRALPRREESTDRLIELAKTEKDPKVRAALVEHLGQMRNPKTLAAMVALYGAEKDPELRRRILRSIRRHDNARALVEIARAETDPKLKRAVVEELSEMKSKEATEYLMELLNK